MAVLEPAVTVLEPGGCLHVGWRDGPLNVARTPGSSRHDHPFAFDVVAPAACITRGKESRYPHEWQVNVRVTGLRVQPADPGGRGDTLHRESLCCKTRVDAIRASPAPHRIGSGEELMT